MFRRPSFNATVLGAVIASLFSPYVAVAQSVPVQSAIAASNVVKSWTSVVEPDGATNLAIRFERPFEGQMASFSGPNGDYVAFDFPGYTVADDARNVGVAQGAVQGVRFVETGKRLRAIVQVVRGTQYKAFVQDGVLIVRFADSSAAPLEAKPVTIPTVANVVLPPATPAPVVSLPTAVAQASAPKAQSVPIGGNSTNAQPARTNVEAGPVVTPTVMASALSSGIALRDIEYKKTGNDTGRLSLDISDPGVKVKVYREGMNLVVELPNTALPRNLAKRMVVENMETPVLAVAPTIPRDSSTKLILEMRGGWDYTFAQNGNALSVDVFKIGDDYKVGGKRVFTGKKLSLSFQQIDVRTVLQILAEFTGLNIIASDSVRGDITLRLNEVPWDQALDIILSSKDLDMRRNGQVLWIAPRAEIATKEQSEFANKATQATLEPLVTETFQLNYQKATALRELLQPDRTGTPTAGQDRGSIRIDQRTNQLFVRDTPTRIEEMRQMIKRVDVPVRQVAIEAKIVEVSDSFAKNVGVKFGLDGATLNFGKGGMMLGSTLGTNSSVFSGTTGGNSSGGLNVNLPGGGINGARPGTFAFTLFNSGLTRFLNLEVSALEADGKAKTISSPRVVTSDGKEATISQGTEIPYLQASSSGAANVAFKPATMELKVIPQITPDGRVTLDLEVKKDSVGQNTSAGPAIDTKQVKTAVLVDNGGTIVIGGIFTVSETNSENKVPVLGDIPVLGNAFKNRQKETSKKEMVIMITPRVIENISNAQ